MIVDMQCPKCRGRATEYDERKWMCLKCGDKFIYEPSQAPKITVNNVANIVGATPYDLDVPGAVRAKPVYVDALGPLNAEINKLQQEVDEAFRADAWFFSVVILDIFLFFLGKWGWGLIVLLAVPHLAQKAWFHMPAFRVMHGLNRSHLRSLKEERASRIAAGSTENVAGYSPLCPYCRAEFPAKNSALNHCLNCGKQFHYVEPQSYPIRSR